MKTRTIASLGILLAAATTHARPATETFDQASPYNWSRTMFPNLIPNEHTLAREDTCTDTCLPLPDPSGRFRVTRCADDREGVCSSLIGTPACDAFALRRDVPVNYLTDTHSRAHTAATGIGAGQEQRVGLVARAHVIEVAGVRQISGGYAAFMNTFNGTMSPVEAVLQIVRLSGPCVESSTLLVTSTPFEVNCNENYRIRFTVAGSSLRASIDRVHLGVGGAVVTEPIDLNSVGPNNDTEIGVEDTAFPSPGLNGVVGYAPTPGHVYWDDVRIYNLTSVTFDSAALNSVIGGQANQQPGTIAYTESGVRFRVARVTPPGAGSQPIFGFGQFVTTPAPLGGGQGLRLSDMAIQPEPANGLADLAILFGRLPGATPQDRWINLALNGQPPYIGSIIAASFPGDNFDIDPFSLPMQGGGQQFGLEIAGPINDTLMFGGHDAVIDSFYSGVLTSDCPADFNGDGAVSVQDIFDFLAAYFAGNASADINGDGAVTVQDIFDFLALYFAGCA